MPKKENEMEIPEKLVEEIGELLADYYTGEDASGLSFVIPFHEDRKLAERIIARIGKAYAEGMPLPGEVGRYNWGGGGIEDWIGQMGREMRFEGGFIALSPFPRDPLGTGTGKEEEGDGIHGV